jgi:hypothetical protein
LLLSFFDKKVKCFPSNFISPSFLVASNKLLESAKAEIIWLSNGVSMISQLLFLNVKSNPKSPIRYKLLPVL